MSTFVERAQQLLQQTAAIDAVKKQELDLRPLLESCLNRYNQFKSGFRIPDGFMYLADRRARAFCRKHGLLYADVLVGYTGKFGGKRRPRFRGGILSIAARDAYIDQKNKAWVSEERKTALFYKRLTRALPGMPYNHRTACAAWLAKVGLITASQPDAVLLKGMFRRHIQRAAFNYITCFMLTDPAVTGRTVDDRRDMTLKLITTWA